MIRIRPACRHVKTIPGVLTVILLFLAIWLPFSVEVRSALADGNANVLIAGPDTWGAVDGLGRVLPDYRQVGPPKPGKNVGIFYFLTNNQPGRTILDNRKVLARNPNAVIGPIGSDHWWAEPLFGYFISADPFVLREDAAMLGDAGINTVIFDNTNGPTYFKVQKALFKTWLRMKSSGNPVPDFACFAGYGAWQTDYTHIYKTGLAKKLWFYWDHKPLMLYKARKKAIPAKLRRFFTLRYCWAWTGGKNKWGWDNTSPTNSWEYAWHSSPKKPEEMPVAVGGWASISIGRSFHDGREPPPAQQHPGLGLNFAEQWRHALKVNPAFIFITGWNEWTATCEPAPGPERFAGRTISNNSPVPPVLASATGPDPFAGRVVAKGYPTFIDEYDPEYSRDVDPMRADKGGLFGGFGDNYYYQMVSYIRRYKGVNPLPFVHPATIHIDGSFAQWRHIGPLFVNNVGLAVHRNSPGWGDKHYINESGRNEIVASKFTYDLKNVYFWVKTRKPITSWRDRSWMLLFLHVPHPGIHAWMGYNYVVDRRVLNNHTSVVEQNVNGKYQWRSVGKAKIRVEGNELQMAIPRAALGITGVMPKEIHFKWADNIQQNGSWTDFYLNGDCGPPFRFYYRAKIRK